MKVYTAEWLHPRDACGVRVPCRKTRSFTTVSRASPSSWTTWNLVWSHCFHRRTAGSGPTSGCWRKVTLPALRRRNCNWNKRKENGDWPRSSGESSTSPSGSARPTMAKNGSSPAPIGPFAASQNSMKWTSSVSGRRIAPGFTANWAFSRKLLPPSSLSNSTTSFPFLVIPCNLCTITIYHITFSKTKQKKKIQLPI